MTGTLFNAAAIVAGGAVGVIAKRGVPQRIERALNQAMGLAVFVIGVNGVVTNMLTAGTDGTLSSSGELLLVVSLVVGVFVGELLQIEENLNGFFSGLEQRFHLTGFAGSFVSGTLIYCVGAMAIIGSINDGLQGDPSVLIVKGTIDGVSSIVLGATMGPGVILAAVPVLLYQGGITLLAAQLSPFLQGELLRQICAVGFVLVGCIGVNFMGGFHIKTANFLPALLVPPVWAALGALAARLA